MKRLSRILVLTLAVGFAAPAWSPAVVLASVDDQRSVVKSVVDELERLQEQADKLAEDYNVAVQEKADLDEEVAATVARIAEKEAELDELRGNLSAVAIRSFAGSGNDVLGPLFSSPEDYSQELRGEEFRGAALDTGSVSTDDFDELIRDLNEEKANLDAAVARQAQLTLDIEAKREQTATLTEQYTARRAEEEAKLGQLIREEEERRAAAALAAAQAEYEAQQAAARNAQQQAAASGSASNSGSSSSSSSSGSNSSSGSATSSSSSGGNSAPAAAAPAPAPPAASGQAGIAVAAAQNQMGVPYVWGTSKPGVSFDCSGLTYYAWAQAGVYLPRNSRSQAAALPSVPQAAVQPGDLVFYYSPVSHVGVYIGGGQMVHAPNSGSVVTVAPISWGKVTKVGRPG